MTLALDASAGLKWVLDEPDSHVAQALATGAEALIMPDFWLNEACNVLWLQVSKGVLSEAEARESLSLLRQQFKPTPMG
jgi:predicted nucleic acid-binding protein